MIVRLWHSRECKCEGHMRIQTCKSFWAFTFNLILWNSFRTSMFCFSTRMGSLDSTFDSKARRTKLKAVLTGSDNISCSLSAIVTWRSAKFLSNKSGFLERQDNKRTSKRAPQGHQLLPTSVQVLNWSCLVGGAYPSYTPQSYRKWDLIPAKFLHQLVKQNISGEACTFAGSTKPAS
jgi:hypothetical protein